MKVFKFILPDRTETIDSMSFKKAVKSFQNKYPDLKEVMIKYINKKKHKIMRLVKLQIGRKKKIGMLPKSCWESAQELARMRKIYEEDGVFPPVCIDSVITKLKNYRDQGLAMPLTRSKSPLAEVVDKFINCG